MTDKVGVARFVDEPPRGNQRKYDWEGITAELRANPGKWGVIGAEDAKPTRAAAQRTAANVRHGIIKGMGKGEFEAVTRENVVYARFIGGEDA